MLFGALDIAAVLLLVLPGFLAYRFAVLRRVDASRRSAIWQAAEFLEYSVYVHLIGAGLAAIIHFALGAFGVNTHIGFLVENSPEVFLAEHTTQAVLWFTLYPLYVIFITPVLGAYDCPVKVSNSIVNLLAIVSNLRSKWPMLPKPEEAYPSDPIWYSAFNQKTEGYWPKIPYVFIKLKNGDAYYGKMHSYPITSDTNPNKDFLITEARYFEKGGDRIGIDLADNNADTAVLLNSANVDSIVIYYASVPLDREAESP